MAFLTELEPVRFIPIAAASGISRLVAPNPGPLTYHGTNTWLVEQPDGLTVIDPGSDHPSHIAAITSAGQVRHILLTHTHPDHLTGAAELHAATGAPIATWATPWAPDFHPHIPLAHGQTLAGLRAIHTPGHASDHLCFEHATPGIVFTGDHVMSWSTSIVSPPDGDMAAYMASLRLLLARQDTLYLCGHGPPLPNPTALVRGMLSHRAGREAAILAALARAPTTADSLVAAMYTGLAPHLAPAASRSVLAHLLKLQAENRVHHTGETWHTAQHNTGETHDKID